MVLMPVNIRELPQTGTRECADVRVRANVMQAALPQSSLR